VCARSEDFGVAAELLPEKPDHRQMSQRDSECNQKKQHCWRLAEQEMYGQIKQSEGRHTGQCVVLVLRADG